LEEFQRREPGWGKIRRRGKEDYSGLSSQFRAYGVGERKKKNLIQEKGVSIRQEKYKGIRIAKKGKEGASPNCASRRGRQGRQGEEITSSIKIKKKKRILREHALREENRVRTHKERKSERRVSLNERKRVRISSRCVH